MYMHCSTLLGWLRGWDEVSDAVHARFPAAQRGQEEMHGGHHVARGGGGVPAPHLPRPHRPPPRQGRAPHLPHRKGACLLVLYCTVKVGGCYSEIYFTKIEFFTVRLSFLTFFSHNII